MAITMLEKATGRGCPEYGKKYRLTGAKGVPALSNGNRWNECEVLEEVKDVKK